MLPEEDPNAVGCCSQWRNFFLWAKDGGERLVIGARDELSSVQKFMEFTHSKDEGKCLLLNLCIVLSTGCQSLESIRNKSLSAIRVDMLNHCSCTISSGICGQPECEPRVIMDQNCG